MAGKIIQPGNLGPEQEDGYTQITDTLVIVGETSFEFPDDHAFRVEDGTLLVYDGNDDLAMAFSTWSAAVMAGTKVVVSSSSDLGDDED